MLVAGGNRVGVPLGSLGGGQSASLPLHGWTSYKSREQSELLSG